MSRAPQAPIQGFRPGLLEALGLAGFRLTPSWLRLSCVVWGWGPAPCWLLAGGCHHLRTWHSPVVSRASHSRKPCSESGPLLSPPLALRVPLLCQGPRDPTGQSGMVYTWKSHRLRAESSKTAPSPPADTSHRHQAAPCASDPLADWSFQPPPS